VKRVFMPHLQSFFSRVGNHWLMSSLLQKTDHKFLVYQVIFSNHYLKNPGLVRGFLATYAMPIFYLSGADPLTREFKYSREIEGRAFARLAFHPDASAHKRDNACADWQTQSSSSVFSRG